MTCPSPVLFHSVTDIGTGRAAGVAAVGVDRGYHPSGFQAAAAPGVITDFGALGTAIGEVSEVFA